MTAQPLRIARRILKAAAALLAATLAFAILFVLAVWMFPEAILTSERVSGLAAPLVRFAPRDPADPAPLVAVAVGKEGFSRRTLALRLRPGCYAPADPADRSEFCVDAAAIAIGLRLDRKTILKLTALRELDVHLTRGTLHPAAAAAPPNASAAAPTGGGVANLFRYLDPKFAWGPLRLRVDRFELPAAGLRVVAELASAEGSHVGTARSPTLRLKAEADARAWTARADAELVQTLAEISIPRARVEYATRGGSSLRFAGALSGRYALESGDADAELATEWKNPSPGIGLIRTKKAALRRRAGDLAADVPVEVLLHGETPLGRPPMLPVGIAVRMRTDPDVEHPEIDFGVTIDGYNFAGIVANSNLEGTLATGPTTGLRWRKGELRVEIADFARTVRRLEKTSWAVPAPFNVFRGPIALRSEPFRETADRTVLPFLLTTDLASQEQILRTETRAEADVAKRGLGLLGVRVKALIRKLQLRLPDYEPLAPVPALARDPRIVRYAEKTVPATEPRPARPAKAVTKFASPRPGAETADGAALPVVVEVDGAPESVVLLNRFFAPAFAASVQLRTETGGVLRGRVLQSKPFEIHFLNREITLERLEVRMDPEVAVSARVSMFRAGFKIFADLDQRLGKTKIALGSEPPLQESEIVSLLIYGMPRNSISSEQTKSVGSAQAAMGSEALGIFSFWAFASTPIESVLYDPETQTYSAVVRLPGGLVASIGSNWENERQVALSKSIGRSWAVSTEIMRDAEGIERGGTLLRWRKSY